MMGGGGGGGGGRGGGRRSREMRAWISITLHPPFAAEVLLCRCAVLNCRLTLLLAASAGDKSFRQLRTEDATHCVREKTSPDPVRSAHLSSGRGTWKKKLTG